MSDNCEYCGFPIPAGCQYVNNMHVLCWQRSERGMIEPRDLFATAQFIALTFGGAPNPKHWAEAFRLADEAMRIRAETRK